MMSLIKDVPHLQRILRQLTPNIRPVFARERCVLEFYGHAGVAQAVIWRGTRNQYYYMDDKPVKASSVSKLRKDLPALRSYLAQFDDHDVTDRALFSQYREILEPYRPRLVALECEAFDFIQHVRERFPGHLCLVSFSGGKDSTVVSDLVRRALYPETALHIFSDTTLNEFREVASDAPRIAAFFQTPHRASRRLL